MDSAARLRMPAIALTDQMQSVRDGEVLRAAQSAGVKPIIGVDLLIREYGERVEPSRLVLLVSERYRLSQSHAARHAFVSRRSDQRRRDRRSQLAESRYARGLDCVVRRSRRRSRASDRRRARSRKRARVSIIGSSCSAIGTISNCNARVGRRRGVSARRARSRGRARRSGRCDERRALHSSRGLRCA